MKRQVRRGCFESNSSSQHSICVMKNGDKYSPKELLDGIYLREDRDTGEKGCVWEPWEDDMTFGRSPFKALGTFSDKWLYACASLVCDYNDDVYKELVKIAIKYVPGLKKIRLPMVCRSVCNKDYVNLEKEEKDYYRETYGKTEKELVEYLLQKEKEWGIEIRYYEADGGWFHYYAPYTGSVDEDILTGFLQEENITLEEYLINKKYVVIQDGDEYCEFDNLKESGLINLDAIDHEY